jgi:hypothetical protein
MSISFAGIIQIRFNGSKTKRSSSQPDLDRAPHGYSIECRQYNIDLGDKGMNLARRTQGDSQSRERAPHPATPSLRSERCASPGPPSGKDPQGLRPCGGAHLPTPSRRPFGRTAGAGSRGEGKISLPSPLGRTHTPSRCPRFAGSAPSGWGWGCGKFKEAVLSSHFANHREHPWGTPAPRYLIPQGEVPLDRV